MLHVLILPSWYATKEQPVIGSFFQEHALAVEQIGLRTGIIYPEIRQLRSFTPQLFLRNYFQKSVQMEGPLPTCRLHGWNLFPKLMKKQMQAYCFFAEKLFHTYMINFGKPDVIHAQSSVWAGIAAKKLSEKNNIPYLITEHASVFMQQSVLGQPWECCWSTPYIRNTFNQAQFVVAVSSALKLKLQPYTNRPIQVIPNLVDTRQFSPKKFEKRGNFNFLTLSHLTRRKNIASLLSAFKKFIEKDQNTTLTIGGDGPERKNLETLTYELKIEKKVHFLGPLSREAAAAAFQAADAFVLASQNETFGVVCIEALASGIPVLATCCGGTEDIISKEAGYLVAVNDEEALWQGLAKMRKTAHTFNPQELHQLAINNYSPEVIAKQYKQLYSHAMHKKTVC